MNNAADNKSVQESEQTSKHKPKQRIDYINQNEAFEKIAINRNLDGKARLLYHALFRLANRSYWAEYFWASNKKLMRDSGIGNEGTLRAVRKRLKKMGFIEYKQGGPNHPGRYSLVKLYDPVPANFATDINVTELNDKEDDEINHIYEIQNKRSQEKALQKLLKKGRAAAKKQKKETKGEVSQNEGCNQAMPQGDVCNPAMPYGDNSNHAMPMAVSDSEGMTYGDCGSKVQCQGIMAAGNVNNEDMPQHENYNALNPENSIAVFLLCQRFNEAGDIIFPQPVNLQGTRHLRGGGHLSPSYKAVNIQEKRQPDKNQLEQSERIVTEEQQAVHLAALQSLREAAVNQGRGMSAQNYPAGQQDISGESCYANSSLPAISDAFIGKLGYNDRMLYMAQLKDRFKQWFVLHKKGKKSYLSTKECNSFEKLMARYSPEKIREAMAKAEAREIYTVGYVLSILENDKQR